jgi:PPP family 3-phenylpropionic acid transporter
MALILLGMGISAFVGFLGLHLIALGGTQSGVGLAWALAAVMEVPLMALGARWFARYSYSRLILFSLGGFALVWGLAALAPSPALIMVVLPGMGICFGIFWVAVVGYASEAAPPGLNATAQSLMGAAQSGLGWSLGSVSAGYLWDLTNGHVVFFFAALMAVLALIIFSLGNIRQDH